MSVDKLNEEFCKKYEARVTVTNTVVPRCTTDIRYMPIGWDENVEIQIDRVPVLEIQIPEDRYRALLEKERMLRDMFSSQAAEYNHPVDQLWDQYEREQLIREEVPAVKAAYEKYLNLLELVKGHY